MECALDLKLAKDNLIKSSLTLVIVKKGKTIFKSDSSSIVGLIKAIDIFKNELNESSIADRVVGKAVALLCAYSKAANVYAITISDGALKSLKKAGICVEFENKVPKILNKARSGICPFEKLLFEINDPELAYEKLSVFVKNHY
ncbi:MAG: DUF1893 domain-containing protein [Candidatus Bathyarchaeia archaeon]